MSDVCEMFNTQDAKGCKRKQDVTNFGAENEVNYSDKVSSIFMWKMGAFYKEVFKDNLTKMNKQCQSLHLE